MNVPIYSAATAAAITAANNAAITTITTTTPNNVAIVFHGPAAMALYCFAAVSVVALFIVITVVCIGIIKENW